MLCLWVFWDQRGCLCLPAVGASEEKHGFIGLFAYQVVHNLNSIISNVLAFSLLSPFPVPPVDPQLRLMALPIATLSLPVPLPHALQVLGTPSLYVLVGGSGGGLPISRLLVKRGFRISLNMLIHGFHNIKQT